MAPDLKFQFQILTLKQYIYLVVSQQIEHFLCVSHFSLGVLNPYQHTDCRIALLSEMQLFQTSGYAAVMQGFRCAGRSKNNLISGGPGDVRCPFLTCCHSSSLWMPMHDPQPSTKQTINRKWHLVASLLTPSVPFSKCQITCSPLSPACFLPSGERGSSSTYFAAQLKSFQSRFKQKDKF